MSEPQIKVAFIGLDTSHSVQFAQYIQDPKIPAADRCTDLIVTRCMRFETPFQGKEGLDARQKQLEELGILVTEDFDEAVADCDAIFLEINDPSLHLEYFKKCAKLNKPIFLDKPIKNQAARKINLYKLTKEWYNSLTAKLSRELRWSSLLLIKRKTGTLYRSSSFQRVRVCAWMPSVALRITTAQSKTGITRSASAEKSA